MKRSVSVSGIDLAAAALNIVHAFASSDALH
jgi:hypothetical protein